MLASRPVLTPPGLHLKDLWTRSDIFIANLAEHRVDPRAPNSTGKPEGYKWDKDPKIKNQPPFTPPSIEYTPINAPASVTASVPYTSACAPLATAAPRDQTSTPKQPPKAAEPDLTNLFIS